ncbi:MAG: 54S ribosomal protein L2 mitochondrial [Geoglossum umbratile]|nr:MAG: 54S ribosomal protein L2 mitochondrial [Geoglossum umbratile]
MRLPRLGTPSQGLLPTFQRLSISAENGLELLRLSHPATKSPLLSFIRHATHMAQRSVNGGKDGPGKRLGAKKSGEQYVIPGNIIFRQRGTLWFPGENCGMGRDHTIYATQAGFVKYYRDPEKHPGRRYIGVVFERHQALPLPRNAARRRRLGLAATAMPEEELQKHLTTEAAAPTPEHEELQIRPGYMYRESNWQIGRTAEKAGVRVKPFRPGDRWAAWRKSTARKASNAEKRGLRQGARKR